MLQYLHQISQKYPEKRVIITGAGSGLGFELCNIFSSDNWKVLAIDINTTNLLSITNNNLSIEQFDITQNEKLKNSFLNFCEKYNGVDILFNNAGVGEGSLFVDYTPENWDWIINIHLKAVINGTYYVLPYLQKANSGLIVNMASMAGVANLPQMSPYNVTKAAVISLSETLSHELSNTEIKVKCYTPTFFQSSILQHSRGDKNTISKAQKIVTSSKLKSNDAAIIIIKSLCNNDETIRFPFVAKVLFYTKKYVPNLYKYLVRKFLVN